MLDVAGALMVQGHPEEAGQWLAGLGRQRWAPRFWRSRPHTRPTSRCCFQSQQCTMQAGTPSNSTKPSARGGGYVSRGRPIRITKRIVLQSITVMPGIGGIANADLRRPELGEEDCP